MMTMAAQDSAYWREFDRNEVSHSAGHYLMAIDKLHQAFGYARATDVAERLEVSRSAASMALAQLRKRGWVEEDAHRFLLLTDEGRRIVLRVEQNAVILSRFFEEVLGAPPEVSQAEACKLEHLVGLETGRRLLWLMEYILSNGPRARRVRKAIDEYASKCAAADDCVFDVDTAGEVSAMCPLVEELATRKGGGDA